MDFKHEPIKLSFRQRIRTFLFDRVLSSQHKKGFLELKVLASCRDFEFLHCLQQCRLRLGRRAIDFVGEQNVAKNWAFDKSHPPSASAFLFVQDFCARDI